jgi:hypothetical protein
MQRCYVMLVIYSLHLPKKKDGSMTLKKIKSVIIVLVDGTIEELGLKYFLISVLFSVFEI